MRRVIGAGLVGRTVDPSDGRARTLVLTDSGAASLRRASAAFALINEHVDARLTTEEVPQLTEAVRRLAGIGVGSSIRDT